MGLRCAKNPPAPDGTPAITLPPPKQGQAYAVGIIASQAAGRLRRYLEKDAELRKTLTRDPAHRGRDLLAENEVAATCLEVVRRCTGL